MATCDRRGPLSRSGHAQPDRSLDERDPQYFKLDERDVGDMILFARRFAAHLRFYHPTNLATGNWSAFFDNDISAILASLVKAPVDPFRNAFADVQKFLEGVPGRPETQLRSHFSLLFHLPLTLYRDVAARQSALETDYSLFPVLQELATRELALPLAALSRYHQGAVDAGLIAAASLVETDYTTAANAGPGPRLSNQIARLVFTGEAFETMTLAPRAITSFAPAGWPAFYAAEPADPAPFADAVTVYDRIYDALNYNLLVSTVEQVFQAMIRIQREAEIRLVESLENFAAHTPHYGLWLAFLSMFDKARDELNDFTGRHLDFYYEEVLRLSRRDPVADHVHLLVELAKGREAHLLPSGTEVRAGKDDLGRDVSYALNEDIVVNRAHVAELMAVRVDEYRKDGQDHIAIRAAPVAVSADGLGEDLPEGTPHFPPFGPVDGPFARVGFAVSDRQLFLREGNRTINLRISISMPGVGNLPGLSARLTAEEGWLELKKTSNFKASYEANEMKIIIKLDGSHPAIVPADPELHGPDYSPEAPVLEILFDFDGEQYDAARDLAVLRDATRSRPKLQTVAKGLRLMSIITADGVADPAASFTPFGARPRVGARWIIGSSEVFSRCLSELEINVTWAETYSEDGFFRKVSPSHYSVTFDYLTGGQWKVGTTTPSNLGFDGENGIGTISAEGESVAGTDAALELQDKVFGSSSRTGFVRMTLNDDFGHGEFIDKKTLALIDKAKLPPPEPPSDCELDLTSELDSLYNPYVDGLPREPYTPEIVEISLDYTSSEEDVARTYRLHPFGIEVANAFGPLLPEFDYSGALFVGVAELDPPERLSLLMQVADGTGDPLLQAPKLEHAWLGAKMWNPFVNQEVIDRTADLAGSGVISFAVPQAASRTASIMPTGRYWIRIAAPENGNAINRLLSVDAQAVQATFVDRGNDPAFLKTPLPAETISKLRVPDLAIKGLLQPYASFGGRGQEDRSDYHRRASERLRHKDRATTMWDHEHLALEVHSSVYRVKALNHTELVRQNGVVVGDNELAPGAVTVVAIPYTSGREHLNPLRPYADRATLVDLHTLLAKRCSPFVRLEVANPKFEEVHVAMKVAFLPEIADTDFYRGEIEAALIEHLTPWRRTGATGVEFNGRVYKSTVVNFVEELPFVDYLEDVKLYHWPTPDRTPVDVEIVRTTTARSILVSAPEHSIGLV